MSSTSDLTGLGSSDDFNSILSSIEASIPTNFPTSFSGIPTSFPTDASTSYSSGDSPLLSSGSDTAGFSNVSGQAFYIVIAVFSGLAILGALLAARRHIGVGVAIFFAALSALISSAVAASNTTSASAAAAALFFEIAYPAFAWIIASVVLWALYSEKHETSLSNQWAGVVSAFLAVVWIILGIAFVGAGVNLHAVPGLLQAASFGLWGCFLFTLIQKVINHKADALGSGIIFKTLLFIFFFFLLTMTIGRTVELAAVSLSAPLAEWVLTELFGVFGLWVIAIAFGVFHKHPAHSDAEN